MSGGMYSGLYDALIYSISAIKAIDEIHDFILKQEASETADGVLEIIDRLNVIKDNNNESYTNKLSNEIQIHRITPIRDYMTNPKDTELEEVLFCDRNICVCNEYNNIDCRECVVTQSQKRNKEHV